MNEPGSRMPALPPFAPGPGPGRARAEIEPFAVNLDSMNGVTCLGADRAANAVAHSMCPPLMCRGRAGRHEVFWGEQGKSSGGCAQILGHCSAIYNSLWFPVVDVVDTLKVVVYTTPAQELGHIGRGHGCP